MEAAKQGPPGGDDGVLIFHLRAARSKARTVATAEALCLLRDLSAVALPGGPLSEQGGLFWIALPRREMEAARARFPRLGYTCAVDRVESISEPSVPPSADASAERVVRWRRRTWRLVRVWEEDAQAARADAPDRRVFLFETGAGEVRPVRGYRGDGGPLSRRGLPVCDARLLVNLARARSGAAFLDPFAGIGGIVREALTSGCRAASCDVDPALRHGLSHLTAGRHCVADARRLPFASAAFEAVATEPPYHEQAGGAVRAALREMARVLRAEGRLVILCAAHQAEDLRREAAALGLTNELDAPINRKGLDVVALAWRKQGESRATMGT